jgi:hypothetical protein
MGKVDLLKATKDLPVRNASSVSNAVLVRILTANYSQSLFTEKAFGLDKAESIALLTTALERALRLARTIEETANDHR